MPDNKQFECNKCHMLLNKDKFRYRTDRGTHRRVLQCRQCESKISRSYNIKRANAPRVEVAERGCSKCNQIKAGTEFRYRYGRPISVCRVCERKAQKRNYEKKRGLNNERNKAM